jgi:hypothetical protein
MELNADLPINLKPRRERGGQDRVCGALQAGGHHRREQRRAHAPLCTPLGMVFRLPAVLQAGANLKCTWGSTVVRLCWSLRNGWAPRISSFATVLASPLALATCNGERPERPSGLLMSAPASSRSGLPRAAASCSCDAEHSNPSSSNVMLRRTDITLANPNVVDIDIVPPPSPSPVGVRHSPRYWSTSAAEPGKSKRRSRRRRKSQRSQPLPHNS